MKKNKTEEYGIREIVASNITRLRKTANLSQLALAKRTGLIYNFVNDIENRKKGISLETIGKLSKALGAEPYQLFLTPAQWDSAEKYQIIGMLKILNKDVSRLFEYIINELLEREVQNDY